MTATSPPSSSSTAVANLIAGVVSIVSVAGASSVYLSGLEPLASAGAHADEGLDEAGPLEVAGDASVWSPCGIRPGADSEGAQRLRHLVGLAGLALDKAVLHERSREQARRDSLTGLLGHRMFHEEPAGLEAAGEPFTSWSSTSTISSRSTTHGHPAAITRCGSSPMRSGRGPRTVTRLSHRRRGVLRPAARRGPAEALVVAERLRQPVARWSSRCRSR